jgi:phage terminase small subunit
MGPTNLTSTLTSSLTKKQQLFVKARNSGASKTQAAIAAGYSAKTACAAGSRLAKHRLVMPHLVVKTVGSPARKVAAKKVIPAVKPTPPAATTEQPPPDRKPATYEDPRTYLRDVMNNVGENPRLRLDAAKALLASEVKKAGEVGKKAARVEAAKNVVGRFSASAPPKLVAAGGKKV